MSFFRPQCAISNTKPNVNTMMNSSIIIVHAAY
jgi:hypothetical protein